MTMKIKRRHTGAAGAPATLASGQFAVNDVDGVLYLGTGDDGSGNAVTIVPIGGAAFVKSLLLGAANGVAQLDSSGKIPTSQLPASVTGSLTYAGTWNASTNSPTLTSGSGTKGTYYKVSTSGTTTVDGISQWSAGDIIAFDGTTWDKIDGLASEVISVAGLTGAITSISLKAALSLAVADVSGAAPLASPAFTGTPTVPTASAGTNTTQAASTAFVGAAVTAGTAGLAALASPAFTGTPTAPTAAAGTNTTQLATTAFAAAAAAAATDDGTF